jgi:hypothetical protein
MADVVLDSARARMWVLMAVDACDRAGLVPISKFRFHRLIFLSNCLADLFRAAPPAKRVLKYKRGPYYPDVQWQVDRLVTMGQLTLANMTLRPDGYGPWMEADYGITNAGIAILATVRATPLGLATARYIDEVVFAFAHVQASRLDDLALRELNYAAPGIADGALITFEEAQNNQATLKTDEFERCAPEILAERAREKLQLYLRYLEAEAV